MKLRTANTKKELKISSIKNANRKPREVKAKLTSPDIFYSSSNRSYSWCDKCDCNAVHAVHNNIITCLAGHSRTLVERYVIKSKKQLAQERKEARAVDSIAPVLFFV